MVVVACEVNLNYFLFDDPQSVYVEDCVLYVVPVRKNRGVLVVGNSNFPGLRGKIL